MHLFEDDGHGKPFCDDDDSMDEVLLLASQAYESRYAEEHQTGVSDRSRSSHLSAVPEVVPVKQTSPSCFIPKVKNGTEVNSEANDTSANTTRFASPKSSKSVEEVRKSAIPKKPGKILDGQRERGTVGRSSAWRSCHQRNWKRDMN